MQQKSINLGPEQHHLPGFVGSPPPLRAIYLITTAMPRERRYAMMATRRKAQFSNRSDGTPGLRQAPAVARWLMAPAGSSQLLGSKAAD